MEAQGDASTWDETVDEPFVPLKAMAALTKFTMTAKVLTFDSCNRVMDEFLLFDPTEEYYYERILSSSGFQGLRR